MTVTSWVHFVNPGASSDTQGQPRNPGPLDRCVVSLTAPELAAENLIGAAGLAEITGIAPSTLRAYIARGEADVPLPQAIIGGRSLWARPVAEEWAEQRQRDPDAVNAAVSAPSHYGDPVPAGQAELAATLTRSFLVRPMGLPPLPQPMGAALAQQRPRPRGSRATESDPRVRARQPGLRRHEPGGAPAGEPRRISGFS